MKKEILMESGECLYGNQWVSPLADDLNINRKTIQRYNSGELDPNPRLQHEIIALFRSAKRKNQ